ncbi:Helix-turn-helix domain [Actinokineospora globicatena]|nr:Helix-turn-helix domain [Actinokineospora globicatena]GLW80013.1 hypothetical protein Aglo01_44940 [Actinokineospora globicatena]GLW86842.1 hypothetical protein Aglo02_44810 [Actinokineospora globicatena]
MNPTSAPDDWVAVAQTINERMTFLGLRQRELADRSHVSQAVVREIQHRTIERRRSTRTLEAISTALGLHPDHLDDVRQGNTPRPADAIEADPVPSQLRSIEQQLALIVDMLGDLQTCKCRSTH